MYLEFLPNLGLSKFNKIITLFSFKRCLLTVVYVRNIIKVVQVIFMLLYFILIVWCTYFKNYLRDPELSNVSRTLLSEIVISLSEDELGSNNWREILSKGFSVLPVGTSSWSHCFLEMDLETQISIIIYYYFYLLSCTRWDIFKHIPI